MSDFAAVPYVSTSTSLVVVVAAAAAACSSSSSSRSSSSNNNTWKSARLNECGADQNNKSPGNYGSPWHHQEGHGKLHQQNPWQHQHT